MRSYSYLFTRFHIQYQVKLLKYKTFKRIDISNGFYYRPLCLNKVLFIFTSRRFSQNIFWANTSWSMQYWIFIFMASIKYFSQMIFMGTYLVFPCIIDSYFIALSKKIEYRVFLKYQIHCYRLYTRKYTLISAILEWQCYMSII